jgi:hypothetical protein
MLPRWHSAFRQISVQVNNQGGKVVQDFGGLSCGIIQMTLEPLKHNEEYKINFGT